MPDEDYYTLWTIPGQGRLATAIASGIPLVLTEFRVGDGGGTVYNPSEGQTALVNPVHTAPINSLRIGGSANEIIAECVIPTDEGGWYIRELGLYDGAGDLMVIAKVPETYKPAFVSGSSKDLILRVVMEVSNADAVTLLVDPAIVLASKHYVMESIEDHRQEADPHPNLTVPDATIEIRGKVELATIPECLIGIDTERAVTPAGLRAAIADYEFKDMNRGECPDRC